MSSCPKDDKKDKKPTPTQFFCGAGAAVDPWLDGAVAVLWAEDTVIVELVAGSAGDEVRIADDDDDDEVGASTDNEAEVAGAIDPDGVVAAAAEAGAGIVPIAFMGGGGTGPFRTFGAGAITAGYATWTDETGGMGGETGGERGLKISMGACKGTEPLTAICGMNADKAESAESSLDAEGGSTAAQVASVTVGGWGRSCNAATAAMRKE